MINVLDKGYVRLVDVMGSDLDVVNAARVSFDKEVTELSDNDIRLISYLIKNKHDSTLRHCALSFEVYAPLMVARQWYKHAIASSHLDDQLGWNESSRRYITEQEEFFMPTPLEWRSAPDNKKQGSGEPLPNDIGAKYSQRLAKIVKEGRWAYEEALNDGMAPEQARLFLPAYGMYVRWRWTVSLNAVLHFLSLRKDSHAQWEIQQYAKAIDTLTREHYPLSMDAWDAYR